ncbi:type III-A CRISPR-associated protein Cas10/Csm1 [Cardiobacterium hominis]|uniref:type III-A CRISPR-associated protein Cas10/Csm1 n=1 Tax=Cardiobacterium hominis TaxID=2718 RepID=UPI0028ECFD2B|nr:type III-A CRISPR-associated protein Cas10/Csm1 [Cardiobacterium hominis]
MTPLDTACATAFAALLPGIAALAGKTTADLWPALAPQLPAIVQRDIEPLLADSALQNTITQAAAIAAGTNPATANATKLRSLFAAIRLKNDQPAGDTSAHYPRAPLNPHSIFPGDNSTSPDLWQAFLAGLQQIPQAHRNHWPLWLDHFDTLWQSVAHAVPAAHSADVSLYDHSKTTAALATALWLRRTAAEDSKEILLIQGDFFGIQNFIFAAGSATNRRAAKILRGRSFHVSLFAEVAALKVLEACALPPTAQIQNAAGKFLIIAPNTAAVRDAVTHARTDMNAWLLEHCYGQVALGIATQTASRDDFSNPEQFAQLVQDSFEALERAKLQRFDLTGAAPTALPVAYPNGVCPYDQRLPATGTANNPQPAILSADQITIGEQLFKKDRLLILDRDIAIHPEDKKAKKLQLSIFGYTIAFTKAEHIKKDNFELADELRRCWDFSLPQLDNDSVWHGYARRYINAYVPRFRDEDLQDPDKYRPMQDDEEDEVKEGHPKTYNHLACEELQLIDKNWRGKIAIATLKGDVDNLGSIFQKGLAAPSLAKMAALSRQMNQFFSLWLPAYCAAHARNTYTVFAGGDDFFLIGPWLQIQALAAAMRENFKKYTADNPQLTFSAGIAISKPGLPVPKLSAYAEEALEKAKNYPPRKKDDEGSQKPKPSKNAICIYGETVAWPHWDALATIAARIAELQRDYGLSTAYLYNLLHFTDLAAAEHSGNIEASMWRSRLYYQTRRFINQQKCIAAKDNAFNQLSHDIGNYISEQRGAFRIPLFNHFYQQREK